jgi:hypothetical protein
MSINPKILAKMGREGDGAVLEGSLKQVEWAQTLRQAALKLKWPEATRAMLSRIKDATWWIANQGITRSMKFKPPEAKQLASSCSPPAPGINGQSGHSAPAAHASAEFAQKKQANLDERVSDAEKWAASVSQNPKLAESAILAVLSKLYAEKKNKEMVERLRTTAWMRLGEAQCVFAKDENAIRRMLETQ